MKRQTVKHSLVRVYGTDEKDFLRGEPSGVWRAARRQQHGYDCECEACRNCESDEGDILRISLTNDVSLLKTCYEDGWRAGAAYAAAWWQSLDFWLGFFIAALAAAIAVELRG